MPHDTLYDNIETEFRRISPVFDFPIEVAKLNQRQTLLKEIYGYYLDCRNHRKVANWKRYVQWLKECRTPDSKEAQAKFKKTKLFIKEMKDSALAYKLSHIPTKDLFYFTSVGKDMLKRKENFSAWLFGSIKSQSYPQG